MPRMIFINLPVTDLVRSTAFYAAAGAVKNPQFSDAHTACMVFSDTISVMLLDHDRFRGFCARPIADARATAQVLLALSADDRAAVDTIVAAGAAAGGRADPNAAQDHGFMYGRSVEDPDGHIWEVIWMDAGAVHDAAAA